MASKIFAGDMPELVENIFKNVNNDNYSLYSCALVSRHWCRISIPIIWQDPFKYAERNTFISKYFSSLDENEKLILKNHGINEEFSKTLFDYAKFLKVLDLSRISIYVKKWIESQLASKSYDDSLIYHISNLLIKLYIESGATLHKLDIYICVFNEFKPEIINSLRRNEQFLSRIQYLFLSLIEISEINTEIVITLLKILEKTPMKLNVLQIDYDYFTVSSGENRKKFHGIVSALECQIRSLREVLIADCDYSEDFQILMNCENLEILRIRYCNYRKLLKKFDHNRISTFELVDCQIDASEMRIIFEKSGTSLQRLKLESIDGFIIEQSLLLGALKSFCPNITFLDISFIEISIQFLDLISNLQKLQFLTLWLFWSVDETPNEVQIIQLAMQIARALPLTLQYLDLRNSRLNPYIGILLNNCNAPLKQLLIESIDGKKNAEALVKFCKRKRTLKYVGVDNYCDWELDDNFLKVDKYVTVVLYDDILVDC
ncbi:hypothetical protein F8M41_022923 [Gigaspora margarita]|uniref:F-box domain-containing protein n=1 Tax=Gigaspora margarita TaxID=4874 RepID=A0A8H4EHN8_GIGMA|nr:hypothetical protein F8M41_022923 [Gigaspora margarita]